jgi:hypothetical protein
VHTDSTGTGSKSEKKFVSVQNAVTDDSKSRDLYMNVAEIDKAPSLIKCLYYCFCNLAAHS